MFFVRIFKTTVSLSLKTPEVPIHRHPCTLNLGNTPEIQVLHKDGMSIDPLSGQSGTVEGSRQGCQEETPNQNVV